MIDLSGSEVRLQGLDVPLLCEEGTILELSTAKNRLHLSLPGWENLLTPGMNLLLQDGLFMGKVMSVDDLIRIKLSGQGLLKPNAHVSLPEIEYPQEFVSEKDISDLKYALSRSTDYVALSFIHNAKNISYFRDLIEQINPTLKPLLVAKFESRQSMSKMDEIIAMGDCFFVARGDMGTENPLELVPYYQKVIIKKCLVAGKEAFVATQMLESMINSPLPTRAEVTDVANAVLDGAAAVTLSAETALGKYPVKAIKMMKKIAEKAEEYKDKL
jgi:pyruvate kinase